MNQFLQGKIIFSLILLFSIGVFLFVLSSCKEKELRAMEKIIKNSNQVELFFIENTPTKPSEQIADNVYVCDYKVSSTISISKQQSDSIKLALLDTTNYIYDMEKRCMMMPKYGMRLKSKKDTLDIIVSNNPCAKAAANSSSIKNLSDKEQKKGLFYVDLTVDNTIIKTIEEILIVSD